MHTLRTYTTFIAAARTLMPTRFDMRRNQRHQVCAYRCITSYETKSMERFSLCVLQKHNCMCNSAEIPTLPDPAPQTTFRGEALTHEIAQDLFMGWLGKEAFSWKVVSESSVRGRRDVIWVVEFRRTLLEQHPCLK